ncbi:MAG: pyocin large subunit-like protein [Pseudoalteromonas distincta]|jgi:pyocin large subunit-like protein
MMRSVGALAAGASLFILVACDNGPSAVTPAPSAGDAGQNASAMAPAASTAAARAPVPQVDGRPLWSETQRYSAQENAERAYARNGEAFGATDLGDFVRKAHAFVNDPPAGAETIKRGNGDTLIYDPGANIFAVATAQGAPRTMFKPDNGAAYWEEQKAREATRGDD